MEQRRQGRPGAGEPAGVAGRARGPCVLPLLPAEGRGCCRGQGATAGAGGASVRQQPAGAGAAEGRPGRPGGRPWQHPNRRPSTGAAAAGRASTAGCCCCCRRRRCGLRRAAQRAAGLPSCEQRACEEPGGRPCFGLLPRRGFRARGAAGAGRARGGVRHVSRRPAAARPLRRPPDAVDASRSIHLYGMAPRISARDQAPDRSSCEPTRGSAAARQHGPPCCRARAARRRGGGSGSRELLHAVERTMRRCAPPASCRGDGGGVGAGARRFARASRARARGDDTEDALPPKLSSSRRAKNPSKGRRGRSRAPPAKAKASRATALPLSSATRARATDGHRSRGPDRNHRLRGPLSCARPAGA